MNEAEIRRVVAARGVSEPLTWRSAGHLAAAWGLYAASATVAVRTDHVWVQAPLWLLMAWLLIGNGAVVHEATHHHLFSAARANRIVGLLAGLSIGAPFAVYRAYHLGHHQHSCTRDDPEGAPYLFPSKWSFALVPIGGPLFAVQLLWWSARACAGSPPPFVRSSRQRRAMTVDGLLLVAFYLAMAWVGGRWWHMLANTWLIPWVIALVVLEPLVLIPEHYGAREADASSALRTTRTVGSNRLVAWIYWGNNFHTAHHVAPGVVPQRIRAVTDELVLPNLAGEWTASGYLSFHGRLFARLPWRAPATATPLER